MEQIPLILSDVALTAESGDPIYSHFGYIIDADARIHALTERFFHGVITAILYPEKAKEQNVAAPAHPLDEINVMEYQAFEHEVACDLPLLRVSISQLTGSYFVSKGSFAATPAQIDALARVFKALGLKGSDTLTGEEDDPTVAQYLEQLRQEAAGNNGDAE